MSDQKFCRGCGTPLQSGDPNRPGFVPEDIAGDKGELVCRRCYRISHYGEAGSVQPGLQQVKEAIRKAVAQSGLLLVIADFTDLTGTLPVWAGLLAENDRPYLLVLNKCDLLPFQAKNDEITGYLRGYIKAHQIREPRDIILASGLKGQGVRVLEKRIGLEAAAQTKIACLGAANAGKSSLIRQLLHNKDAKAGATRTGPTVSKFPGTTLGLSNWSILEGRNTLIDTPGLAPGDRLWDRLCLQCAGNLTASTEIVQKLWGIKPHKGLIIGGLVGMESQGGQETVLIVFSAPHFNSHRTDNGRIGELVRENPGWLSKVCKGCFQKFQWREIEIRLEPNMDFAVAGLGWVSLRNAGTDFKVIMPEGIRWEVRPALVGKRSLSHKRETKYAPGSK
ncbi:MAG: 50S ribosome-binding GTPase [Firmicutes bacterium]|nr:50S ribosome-binding GTPase [Bacillota bacterium]